MGASGNCRSEGDGIEDGPRLGCGSAPKRDPTLLKATFCDKVRKPDLVGVPIGADQDSSVASVAIIFSNFGLVLTGPTFGPIHSQSQPSWLGWPAVLDTPVMATLALRRESSVGSRLFQDPWSLREQLIDLRGASKLHQCATRPFIPIRDRLCQLSRLDRVEKSVCLSSRHGV